MKKKVTGAVFLMFFSINTFAFYEYIEAGLAIYEVGKTLKGWFHKKKVCDPYNPPNWRRMNELFDKHDGEIPLADGLYLEEATAFVYDNIGVIARVWNPWRCIEHCKVYENCYFAQWEPGINTCFLKNNKGPRRIEYPNGKFMGARVRDLKDGQPLFLF